MENRCESGLSLKNERLLEIMLTIPFRNGRFINNVFVPDNVEPELPSEFTVSSQEVENKR